MQRNYKVLVLGEIATGKTSLTIRYTTGGWRENYIMTLGANFMVKNLTIEGIDVKLIITDTAGQERFRAILPSFYKNAKAAALVYDVTRKESFEALDWWAQDLQKHAGNIPYIIVGNKIDLESERVVSTQDGKNKAIAKDVKFFETSAKENINVEAMFIELAKLCVRNDKTLKSE